MKEYDYTLSKGMLWFWLALSIFFQVVNHDSFLFIFMVSLFQIYMCYLIVVAKKQTITITENGISVPSLFFQGIYSRNTKWTDIKRVFTWGGVQQAPVIKIELVNGFGFSIYTSFVNIQGSRSKGLDPYQQLLEDIEYHRKNNA